MTAERAENTGKATGPPWTVGDRLRKARESVGIGVQEMADRLGRQRNSIRRWENGDDAQPMVIRAYAHETGVDVAWLTDGDNPSPSGGVPLHLERRRRGRQKDLPPLLCTAGAFVPGLRRAA